jgi:hypothetical protein
MDYNSKYKKYREKYLLLKSKISQCGGANFPGIEHLQSPPTESFQPSSLVSPSQQYIKIINLAAKFMRKFRRLNTTDQSETNLVGKAIRFINKYNDLNELSRDLFIKKVLEYYYSSGKG